MYVNARAIVERVVNGETQVLLQVRDKPGEPKRWELPGGRLEEFEPILACLKREVEEETGLQVTEILGQPHHLVSSHAGATVECLVPFCAYQTTAGPADSMGLFFRVRAEGRLLDRGDGAYGHRWFSIAELRRLLADEPETVDWLTMGVLRFYLAWVDRGGASEGFPLPGV
jgi:8-oxo-dGTP diphosphatase